MKPEQLEIAQLKREVLKLKAERDILKNCPGPLHERHAELRVGSVPHGIDSKPTVQRTALGGSVRVMKCS
jgi:hypothetical protein